MEMSEKPTAPWTHDEALVMEAAGGNRAVAIWLVVGLEVLGGEESGIAWLGLVGVGMESASKHARL